MRFAICRSSEGAVSATPPCHGAVRGPESPAFPGEFQWFLDLDGLETLTAFLEENGGGLGLFSPEEGEEYPVIEIFDDEEEE